jgi:hypothetical protein
MVRIEDIMHEAAATKAAAVIPNRGNSTKFKPIFKRIAERAIRKDMIVFFFRYKPALNMVFRPNRKYPSKIAGENSAADAYFSEATVIKSSFETAKYPNHIGMIATKI